MVYRRNYRYLWSLTPGLVCIFGNLAGSWWVLSNLVYSLVVLSALEWFVPDDKSNHSDEDAMIPDSILIAHVIIQIASLSALVLSINSQRITGWQFLFAAISTGIHTGSSSIIVAHEMIHRKKKLWQFLGKFLLLTACNFYFYVDHLRVHHKWVGTMRDPATARRGESVYAFFLRSVSGQIKSAWNVEKIRLGHEGVSPLNPRNYVLSSIILSFLLSALYYFLAGGAGLLVFVVQAFVANFLLEYTNYIEHYGLWREENVRVNAELSWQSDRVISRFILIDLSRHSDHHFYASKPYHTLRTYDESPVLPGGYASCFYIAMLPPLWYKIIHPRLEKFNPGRIRLSESELK